METKEYYLERVANLFNPNREDLDGGVKQAALRSASGAKSGYEYLEDLADNLTPALAAERCRVFEAMLQPNTTMQMFVPRMSMSLFVDETMAGKVPEAVYKGVGYNPTLAQTGERLDNLDFFAWAKRMQQELLTTDFIVYDASPYEAFNLLDEQPWPEFLSPDADFEFLFNSMLVRLETDQILADNCELRRCYLQAMMAATGVQGQVVSVVDLLRDSEAEFKWAYNSALKWSCLQEETSDIYRNRFGEFGFAARYGVAVIAEMFYFWLVNNVDCKIAPSYEAGRLDKRINKALRVNAGEDGQAGVPCKFFWYQRPMRRQLTPVERVRFGDDPDLICQKLAANPNYADWLNQALVTFLPDSATVNDRAITIAKLVEESLS